MKLIELNDRDTDRYKAFFLIGLQRHRDRFRISPDDEIREPFPTRGLPDSFTLAMVTDADELAGVVSFQREGTTREKIRHKGLLFRMYVAAEHSGRGLGRTLLAEVIRRVREQTDIEQINLTVVATNVNARRLYETVGFRSFARERNALKDGTAYYDEEQMALSLIRQIRPYQPQDETALINVFRKNIPHAFAETELDEYINFLRTNTDPYFVAELNGTVAGACGHYFTSNGLAAHVCWIFTDPDTKGIGGALVRHNLAIISQHETIQTIVCRTSQLAYQFFEKFGFQLQHTKPDFWAPGLDLYFMTLNPKTP